VVNLVAAAALGPALFGTWVLLTLLMQYLTVLSLGVPNGAGRQIPYELGAGRPEAAALAEDVSLTLTLTTGGLAAIVGVMLGIVLIEPASPDRLGTAILLGASLASQQLFFVQQVWLRSRMAFGAAALQLSAVGVTFLVAGVALVWWGVAGLMGAQIISQLAALVLAGRLLVRRPRLRWEPATARRIIEVGTPIMLAGLAFSLLTSIDRWLVLSFLGIEAVGLYGIVGIAVSGSLVVATIVSQQFYPRIAYAYGEGRDPRHLLSLARQQGLVAGVVLGISVVPVVAVASLVIPVCLPTYVAALAPLAVALTGVVIYALSSGYANLLNSVGAQRQYFVVQAVAILADVVIAALFLANGGGLLAVAVASALSMTGYSLLLRWRGHAVALSLPAGHDRLTEGLTRE
jgi:O-antigen/teichoic acid export membrane protein